jgi:hypothetical protein
VQEKPEKRDNIDANFNLDFDFDAEYDAANMHAGESLQEDAEWVTGDGLEDEDTRRITSHTSLDSPLLNQRLSAGMLIVQL